MLARVMGLDPGSLTKDAVLELINRSESESQWLEFKSQLPTREEDGFRELAKDVSAFANALGGVIVFGIKEVDDRAAAPTPVALGRETSTLQKSLHSLVFPRLQQIHWHSVPTEGADKGFLLLEIEPSTLRPHLVWKGDSFSCWRRVEKQSQPLHEADLERLYAERRDSAERVGQRIATLEARTADEGGPCFWLIAAPFGFAGRILASPQSARERMRVVVASNLAQGFDRSLTESDVRIRFGRLESAYTWESASERRTAWTVFADHGEMLRVQRIPVWGRGMPQFAHPAPDVRGYLNSFLLFDAIVTAVVRYRELAREFSVGGLVALRTGFNVTSGAITFVRTQPFPDVFGRLNEAVAADTQLSIEDLFVPRRMMRVVRQLWLDLSTAFGVSSGCPVREDGSIDLATIESSIRPWVSGWATDNAVAMS